MRRLTIWTLILGLLLAPLGAAQAQTLPPQFFVVNQSIAAYTTASIAMANTVNEVTLFQYNIPPGLLQISSSSTVNSSVPLHLMLKGTIDTSGTPIPLNLGVNLGGSTSTVTLVNGVTPQNSLTAAPFAIDCWILPISTSSTSGIGGITHVMECAAHWATTTTAASVATETFFNGLVRGTTSLASATGTQINVLGRWGTGANNANAINIYGGVLIIGN